MSHHHGSSTKDGIEQFFSDSAYQMVNISQKKATFRRAIAQGRIIVGETAFEIIRQHRLPKGDPLALAEIAGITGAKQAHSVIPLCHPLSLDQVRIHTVLDQETFSIIVYCMASTYAKTGVEMEALAGVNAALLAVYDLTKMVESALTITDIRLLSKEGGKQGCWIHPDGIPSSLEKTLLNQKTTEQLLSGSSAAILTISDRASSGQYKDRSGNLLHTALSDLGCSIKNYQILPDEKQIIVSQIQKLVNAEDAPNIIITTGGTGLAPRDVTPEAIIECCDRSVPGFGEMLRKEGTKYTKYSWLSRSIAGIINQTLIIALPGSPKAVDENMQLLKDLLPHALHILTGGNHD